MELNSSIAAVVTGGASGLGEATARALAKHGIKVAIFDMQKDKGETVASEIGGTFCEVNVTRDESVAAGFQETAFGTELQGFWDDEPVFISFTFPDGRVFSPKVTGRLMRLLSHGADAPSR